jgi:hypothetical protein
VITGIYSNDVTATISGGGTINIENNGAHVTATQQGSGSIIIVNNGGAVTATNTGSGTMSIFSDCTAAVTVSKTGSGFTVVNVTGTSAIAYTIDGDGDYTYPEVYMDTPSPVPSSVPTSSGRRWTCWLCLKKEKKKEGMFVFFNAYISTSSHWFVILAFCVFINRSDNNNGPSMASWQIALIVVPCALLIIGAGLYFYKVKQLASSSKSKGDVEQAQGVSLQAQNPIKQIPWERERELERELEEIQLNRETWVSIIWKNKN